MKARKIRDKAVKIDSELFDKIEEFISRKENNLKYSSIKQFIDISVLEKLEKESNIKSSSISNKISDKINNKLIADMLIKKEVKVPSGII